LLFCILEKMNKNESVDTVQLGLKENRVQFILLVIVNAFIGGMIGMERTIFPQFAELTFGVASKTAILSFITAFGITKAITNYFTGRLAKRFGRRNLLLAGWLLAIPVPFMLIYAETWSMVIFANVLLGISQGLTWSSTVLMKIDQVGEKNRGLAMGLNEFAGYFAVGLVAFITGYIADRYGISPYPFYVGIVISIIGFLLTYFWVKDTRVFVKKETVINQVKPLNNVFIETTFKDKTLSSITQAGMVNNLNDGMIWGLLPMVLISLKFSAGEMGIIAALYPAVWGIGQLFTGKMSDLYSKKKMLFWGMLMQGLAILIIPVSHSFAVLTGDSVILGLGTALVYPTFLAGIAQFTTPAQRAESIGVFRLWRDSGYAIGAVLSGITADVFGIQYAILLIGIITVISSLIIQFRMPDSKADVRECIEPVDVQKEMQFSTKIKIIDVRSSEEYQVNHIPGAVNVELSQLKTLYGNIKKSEKLITVCGKGGGRSTEAARLLRQMGYSAHWLCGGTNKWLGISE